MQLLIRARVFGAATLACVLGLVGCTPFHFDDQNVDLLLDHEGDRLELRIQYNDVRSPSDSVHDREKATSSLQRILAKDRLIVLYDMPFDFDEPRVEGEPGTEEERMLREELDAILEGFSVLDAGATLLDEGRPSIWQRIELQNVQRTVAAMNRGINYLVQSEVSVGADGVWDEATLRTWTEKAEENGPWIVVDERGLVVRIPMSPHTLARVLVQLTDPEAEQHEREFAFELLGPMSEFRVIDGTVELIYAPDEAGVIHWNLSRNDLGIDTPIDQHIVESDWFQAALGQ